MTSTEVSRAAAELDEQLSAWRERPLGRCTYLVLDARYWNVRHIGAGINCAVLVAMGAREEDGTLFPNEASGLRLVSAMAAEISEEWETGRIYLNPESE